MPDQSIQLPPIPKIMDYPASIGMGVLILFTTLLVYVSGRFDPTGGVLTISMMITLGFLGAVVFCLFFTPPTNEITSGVIGGLTAAFGAVTAHWLGRLSKNGEQPK